MVEQWYELAKNVLKRKYASVGSSFLSGFEMVMYDRTEGKVDFWRMCDGVRPFRMKYNSMYATADSFQFPSKFLPPIIIDEEHEFHTHLMDRCNHECAIYGYLRCSDWVLFLSMMSNKTIGIRVLSHMLREHAGSLFDELAGRQNQFRDVKGSYIMPTQVEACLQASLLELNAIGKLNPNAEFGCIFDLQDISVNLVIRRENLDAWKEMMRYALAKMDLNIEKNRILLNSILRDSDSFENDLSATVSLKTLITDYLRYVLPWPKEMNNRMRHLLNWIVKYWAFFSIDYVTLWYGDEIRRHKREVPILRGERKNHGENPNRMFLSSLDVKEMFVGMLNVADGVETLVRLASYCLFVEFDPVYDDMVRLLACVLQLPAMGGFGRADKYAAAPRSASEALIPETEKTSIGQTMYENVLKFCNEAKDEKYNPITESEWLKASFGYFKSTGASESYPCTVTEQDGTEKIIRLRTKASVGMLKGMKIFTDDLERRYDSILTKCSTGNRDVPVKATRTIFPIPLTVLVCQVGVAEHLIRYGISDKGTYEVGSNRMAAQISTGESESVGSRILDDRDLIYLSGTSNRLIVTLDYGEYDSHCVYWNFRKPMIDALKFFYQNDSETLSGKTRVELVDLAFGEGRVHRTIWDVGRKIVRGSSVKRDTEKTSNEWKQNHNKYKNLVFPPKGVHRVFCPLERIEDPEGDILICSGIGEDYVTLSSHGSGELTTLLMNSLQNISLCDEIFRSRSLCQYLDFKIRRVVGDDLLMVANYIGDSNLTKADVDNPLDVINREFADTIRRSGHVCNLSKCFCGFGFCEYRQTHCLRGVMIPKDQIMVLSSEKTKFVDDVKSLLASIKAMFLTKVSRGMNEDLAEDMFWFVAVVLSRISIRRYIASLDDSCVTLKSVYLDREIIIRKNKICIRGKSSRRNEEASLNMQETNKTRVFLIPHFYFFVLPASMGGIGAHHISFFLTSTESMIGSMIHQYGHDRVFLFCLEVVGKFAWYKVEGVEKYVDNIYAAADSEFIGKLAPETTGKVRRIVTSLGHNKWWNVVEKQPPLPPPITFLQNDRNRPIR